MSASFTPGPWGASEMRMDKESWASLAGDHDLTIVRANWDTFTGDVIACVWADDDHDEMANARLIAAAPELYGLLHELASAVATTAMPAEAVNRLEPLIGKSIALLAKARGETA